MPGSSLRTNVANVLVIGTGAAGLRAAIAAHQAGREVVVIASDAAMTPHTVLAAGGQSSSRHGRPGLWQSISPTRARATSAEPRESTLARGPRGVRSCRLGRPFAGPGRPAGSAVLGAPPLAGTCDAVTGGRAILRTLVAKVAELGLTVVDDHYVSELLVSDGVCFGALAFDLETGERTVFLADAVVLAAGGHTRIWRRSSSRRDENTGDGMYLALRAGCRLQDMELVQFPTGWLRPGSSRDAGTEAVRRRAVTSRTRWGSGHGPL